MSVSILEYIIMSIGNPEQLINILLAIMAIIITAGLSFIFYAEYLIKRDMRLYYEEEERKYRRSIKAAK